MTYIVALDNGTQYIRDIVDDQFSKDEMTEAIKHCNMDAAAALNHLIEKGIASLRIAIIRINVLLWYPHIHTYVHKFITFSWTIMA